jgi:RNA polymerase sigma-70 factor (ECF subfamily)
MRRTGDYYFSGDILQESFTRYLEKYGKEGTNTALLYTIARNAVVDGLRKQGRDMQLFDEQEHSQHNPESNMAVREDYRRVLAAMQELAPEEKDVLSLVVSSDLSYREIARIIGISEGKVRVHRARVKLREMMKTKDFRKVQGQPAANREARALVEVWDPTDPGPAAAVMADREPVAVTAVVPGDPVQAVEVPADQVQAAEVPVVPDPVAEEETAVAIRRNWNSVFAQAGINPATTFVRNPFGWEDVQKNIQLLIILNCTALFYKFFPVFPLFLLKIQKNIN